jgi:hypothetical protein
MLRIPLQLAGITSYIPTRVPREDEINDLQELELTPQMNVWNPHSSLYRDQEDSMLDYKGCLREENLKTKNRHLISSATTYEPKHVVSCVIDRSTDTVLLADDLIARRHCSNTTPLLLEDKINRISSIRSSRDHMINVVKNNGTKTDLTSERLAEVFDISNSLAIKTMGAVTRMCPHNTADITLNRRYATNDRMLQYSRMLKDLFTDTMFAARPKKNKRGTEVKGTN